MLSSGSIIVQTVTSRDQLGWPCTALVWAPLWSAASPTLTNQPSGINMSLTNAKPQIMCFFELKTMDHWETLKDIDLTNGFRPITYIFERWFCSCNICERPFFQMWISGHYRHLRPCVRTLDFGLCIRRFCRYALLNLVNFGLKKYEILQVEGRRKLFL